MYTLKGVFPDQKKIPKKNYIRENAKQLKDITSKTATESNTSKPIKNTRSSMTNLNQVQEVKTNPMSNKNQRRTPSVARKTTVNNSDVSFKKGDMSEFLKRKQLPSKKPPKIKMPLTARSCDVACQTIESELSRLTEKQLLLLEMNDDPVKFKEGGDNRQRSSTRSISPDVQKTQNKGDSELNSGRKSVRTNNSDAESKDPYLPPNYQKGVLPKYLRERREEELKTLETEPRDADCPPGHVPLPDTERKETLKMLRSSFAELVSELNKMPLRTDTLRMRSRKLELEKQLSKLEEGIKVFSRPKVFVRIGE